jgi:hypothetical protein
MLAWPLENIDFMIIGILFVLLLLTFLWRQFFRWDTRYGLKQRGTDMRTHHTFEPPFPRVDGATIAVFEQARLDPRLRCTWLVQGLLGAGFRVLLARSVGGIAKILQENRLAAIINHGPFTRKDEIGAVTTCIEVTVASGIPRAIFVNEGGTLGLKVIVDGLARASNGNKAPQVRYYLISCASSPLQDAELALFHDALVVRRSKAMLRDAELQAIGTMLKWVGN